MLDEDVHPHAAHGRGLARQRPGRLVELVPCEERRRGLEPDHAAASRSRFNLRFRFHRHDVEQTIRSERPGTNRSAHSTHWRGSCATRRAVL
jgi:hypothetical protein